MVRSKTVVQLSELPAGSKFKLYARYRDGGPRPRYHYGPKRGGRYLAGETLTVIESRGEAVLCAAGKFLVPLSKEMRVLS